MNSKGGLLKAKKQFLKDLQEDKDFAEYKENSTKVFHENTANKVYPYFWDKEYYLKYISNKKVVVYFGVVSIDDDVFINDKKNISKIIKQFIK